MNNSKEYKKVPEEIVDIYERYNKLHIPYSISNRGKTIRPRIFKGKGSIEAIEKYVLEHPSKDTGELLKDNKIGIDCSGFISYIYEAYTMNKFHKHVWEFFNRKSYNPIDLILFVIQPIVSKLNAKTLVSDINTKKIEKVIDAKPMDLIKLSGGRHVVMIYEIWYEGEIPTRMSYIHSSEGVGVCKGYITITNPDESITKQQWEPLEDFPKYDPGYLIRYHVNMNGIRRPLFLT